MLERARKARALANPDALVIAGQDPVEFCRRFREKIRHVHIKDVSESLAAAVRGDQTGIAVSQCAVGDGVNAENIKKCLEILRDQGFDGVLSIEHEDSLMSRMEGLSKAVALLKQTVLFEKVSAMTWA